MKHTRIFAVLAGLCSTMAVHGATLYVDLSCTNATPPFSDWNTAATNIQDAIDASTDGDHIWVTNGVYQTGGKVMAGDLMNRIAIYKAVAVQSVNGPLVTIIAGIGATNGINAVRCAWLTNNAALMGFTLTRGATRNSSADLNSLSSGGAIWCASSQATVSSCILISNAAFFRAGGAYQGTLNGCFISSNAVPVDLPGGAVYAGTLNNCTVVSNYCAGLTLCQATNCISYYNLAGNYSGGSFTFSCTTPAAAGTGNFTNAPQFFEDRIHLVVGSPCVGAGTVPITSTDIFGQPWGTPPSVGCAEAASLSQPMLQAANVVSNSFQFSFNAQYGVSYTVQYTTNLSPPVTWQTQQSVFFAPAGIMTIQDPAITNGTRFYRVFGQ